MPRSARERPEKAYVPRRENPLYEDPTVDAFQRLARSELTDLSPDQRRTVAGMIAHHRVTSYIGLEGVAEANWRRIDVGGCDFGDDEEVMGGCINDANRAHEIYDAVRKKAAEIREGHEERARTRPV